jgi:hypothetical protein
MQTLFFGSTSEAGGFSQNYTNFHPLTQLCSLLTIYDNVEKLENVANV